VWDSFVKLYSDALSDRCPRRALKGKEHAAAKGGDAEEEEDELEDEMRMSDSVGGLVVGPLYIFMSFVLYFECES